MSYQLNHRNPAIRQQPPVDGDVLDVLLIDDELDDYLDRHIAEIRESLADFRNL